MLDLIKSISIDGVKYDIRNTDFRHILKVIIPIMTTTEIDDEEKVIYLVCAFFKDFNSVDDVENVDYNTLSILIDFLYKFVGCFEEHKSGKKLMDWGQDARRIVSAINSQHRKDIRELEYLHWFTFIDFYYGLDGNSEFALICRIRTKKSKGKKLDKDEQEYYRNNFNKINIAKEVDNNGDSDE